MKNPLNQNFTERHTRLLDNETKSCKAANSLNSICTLNEISIKVQKYFEGSFTKFSKMSLEEISVRMF